MNESVPTMIDLEEAHRILFSQITPLSAVEMPLKDSLYRTLAAPICSDIDQPPFDRSVMDGYAVRAVDVVSVPVTLRVVGQLAAGVMSGQSLSPKEAIQINTGAAIPPCADAVVRVEDTEVDASSNTVVIKQSVQSGNFITPKATYSRTGDEVLRSGSLLAPAQIGVAASAGASTVQVYRQPVVAVLTTGDELIDIDHQPSGAQIRNSNQYQLDFLLRSAHVQTQVLDIVSDNRHALKQKIEEGLRYDVLCVTGGISMGAFDFVPEVLVECGAMFHFQKLAIKPGRPVIFATKDDRTLIFALPGNPVSAWIGFELLVRPAIAALQGRSGCLPTIFNATLNGEISTTRNRQTFLPARAWVNDHGQWQVEPVNWFGSGDALGLGQANAMMVRPPDSPAASTGTTVSIMLFECV